jgi:hypothetical protein
MNVYVANSFSLGMVPKEWLHAVRLSPCMQPPDLEGAISVVGHADTAAVLGVPFNRSAVALEVGDTVFVAQLRGGRLPEGATSLPPGAEFDWIKVTI